MTTIETLIARGEPVAPDVPGSAILARFDAEPNTLVIPVVDGERPLGLIERDSFLLKMAGRLGPAQFANRPASCVMDSECPIIEAGVRVDAIASLLIRSEPGALMRGFIVTREGAYYGAGTALNLLQAINEQQCAENQALRDERRAQSDKRAQNLVAAQTRSRFMSVMSHALRTPLNGVLAVAELLRRQPLNDAAHSHVQTIAESSESLLRILQDAVDLSRAEAGELELSPCPTPLRALMDNVQTTWAPRAAEDGVNLIVGYEGDTDLAADIDATRLRQVFHNLIGNALKFARDGVVEASLKAWADGNRVHMEARVRDSGPGVDMERMEAIFEPFVHDAGRNGAGLGLSISRELVARMGGRIWAENNAGCGATFAFDLTADLAAAETTPETNVAQMTELEFNAQPHILIVDDNATNRVVAQALCEMFGCTSETAEDGVEAVAAVKERPFDLVLMDIKMPRMDGVQATTTIRALPGAASGIPIIALTANADHDDAQRYLAAGMAAVVEKPIKPERLRMAMSLALNPANAEHERSIVRSRSA